MCIITGLWVSIITLAALVDLDVFLFQSVSSDELL